MLSDIVVEAAYEGTLPNDLCLADGLSLDQETRRILEIVQLFVQWLPSRDTIISSSGFE